MTAQVNLPILWSGTGTRIDPDVTLGNGANYQIGWVEEIPTFEEFNFVLHALDSNLLALAEKGNWDYEATITYAAGATVYYGGLLYTCVADGTVGITPGTAVASWVLGFTLGNSGPDNLLNQQGLLISNVGGYTSTTLWEGNDITVKSALPVIALESTGATDNWLIGNIEGEVCVANVAAVTTPDSTTIAKSDANTHRIFHEGHAPTQAEVSGTIPDAASNGTGYVRKNGTWVAESVGLGDAPSDGNPYARKDAGWEVIPSANIVGDIKQTIASQSTMLAAGWLRMDGEEVSRTTYATLYALPGMGNKFGDGNGVDTFNTPKVAPIRHKHIRFQTSTAMAGLDVAGIEVNHANGDVWAVTRQGALWKLAGGKGDNWVLVNTLGIGTYNSSYNQMLGIALNSTTGDVYVSYLSTPGYGNFAYSGVYKLAGGTGSFIEMTGLPGASFTGAYSMDVDVATNTIFVVNSNNGGPWFYSAIGGSTNLLDRSANWQPREVNFRPSNGKLYGIAWYNGVGVPATGSVIESSNGGTTWTASGDDNYFMSSDMVTRGASDLGPDNNLFMHNRVTGKISMYFFDRTSSHWEYLDLEPYSRYHIFDLAYNQTSKDLWVSDSTSGLNGGGVSVLPGDVRGEEPIYSYIKF